MSIVRVPSFSRKKKEKPKKKFWSSFLESFNNCLSSITKEENKLKDNIENNNKKLDKKISESNDKINAHLSERKSLIKQKNIITLERNNYEKQFNQYKKRDDQLNSQIEQIDKKVAIIKDDQTKTKKINLKLNEELKIEFNSKVKKLELKKKFG